MLLTDVKDKRVYRDAIRLSDNYGILTRSGGNELVLMCDRGVIVFDGQIFNYNKTKYTLETLLVDTFDSLEPEQAAFESAWWDGFWSICFYEESTGKIYCWTDPLGKKQLYYTTDEHDISLPNICTEIVPLVKDKRAFDRMYRSEVFKWGYNFDDRTPWSNIKRVIPNRLYVFSPDGGKWVLDTPLVDWLGEPPMENPRDLFGLMMQAVNDRVAGTEEGIGMMLSGGLDSSIIAAILKELDANVRLFTINNGDDYPFAHMMADHLGLPLTDLSYNMDEPGYVESCFRYNETPIDLGSVVPNQAMFKNIPTNILLSGDGADELFGGYHRIDDYDSQLSDVFQELSYYHLPRLSKACFRYNKELRNPFLAHDVIRYALKIPYNDRVHKKILKDVFGPMLPLEIVQRGKLPLKNDELKKDPLAYRKKIHAMFYNPNFYEHL